MRKIVLVVLAGLAPAIPAFAAEGHAPGTVKTDAQIKSDLEKSTSPLGIVAGQATTVVETGTGQMVVRRRQDGPNNASVHDDLTEIYNIVAGSGTFVTGGTFASDKDRTAGITGGVARDVKAGDFVVLPPGTPQWFRKINGSITYVETRFANKK